MTRDPLKHLVLTIGAMKSGTTSLHSYMHLHPQICMSAIKEPSFFVEETRRGRSLRWYRANLQRFQPQLFNRAVVWGESSTNYSKYPMFDGVPERIVAAAPDTRFIYIMRDPVRRILSQYVHNIAHGRETRAIDEVFANLTKANKYVATSMYWLQLSRYFSHVDPSRFLLLTLEQMSADPPETMRRVFAHVGVDSTFTHPQFGAVLHDSSVKAAPTELGRRIQEIPLVGELLRTKLGRLIERPFGRPQRSAELEDRLRTALRPDIEQLRANVEVETSGWGGF